MNRFMACVAAVAIAGSGLVCQAVGAEAQVDWPKWRGPNGDGITADDSLANE
jgi:hypothetical protein